MRPEWDSYFLGIAYAVAMRADCTRRLAGAVVVDPFNRVVSTGYNGAPAGRPGCASAGACPRGRLSLSTVAPGAPYSGAGECDAVHAEANALLHGDATRYRGGTLYVVSLNPDGTLHRSQEPCDGCNRLISGANLSRWVTTSASVRLPAWFSLTPG